MWTRARITSLCRIGTLLILLNVFAPLLTQMLRSNGVGMPVPMELCVTGGFTQVADAGNLADGSSPDTGMAGSCPFCTHAPVATALPTVVPALLIEQLRAAATLDATDQHQPASEPPRPAARPRAPPRFA